MPSFILLDFDVAKTGQKINHVKFWKKIRPELLKRMAVLFKVTKYSLQIQKVRLTRKGFHVYLFSKRVLENKTICFIQLFLGSDRNRELFNWLRIKEGKTTFWNVLFSRKYDNNLNIKSQEREFKENI